MGKDVRINIKRLTQEYKISLRELSRRTDIRHSTLSELANHKRQNIHFGHIIRIADALDISDISKIIEIVETED